MRCDRLASGLGIFRQELSPMQDFISASPFGQHNVSAINSAFNSVYPVKIKLPKRFGVRNPPQDRQARLFQKAAQAKHKSDPDQIRPKTIPLGSSAIAFMTTNFSGSKPCD
ncbi:MAG: hypothetical protein V9G14_12145 [Cypionkella sp.]